MKGKKLTAIAVILFSNFVVAQIGINISVPRSTLDVAGFPTNTAKLDGIIPPSLTGNQLRAKNYTSSQTGAFVYVSASDSAPSGQTINVTLPGYYYFDGAKWVRFSDVNQGVNNGTFWGLTGNSGTTPVTNFLGTTDNQPLVLRTNNTEWIRLTSSGNLGINQTAPSEKLNISNGNILLDQSANPFVRLQSNQNTLDQGGYLEFTENNVDWGSKIRHNTGSSATFSEGLYLERKVNGIVDVTAVFDQSNGNIGFGSTKPTNKLHIIGTDPLRLEGLQTASIADNILTVNSTGIVKNNSIDNILSQKSVPLPSVFALTNTLTDFLNGVPAGANQETPMTLIKNQIPGLTYDGATSTITFPAGLYQINYVYEALHNNTGCTISSYIVDFPEGSGATIRRIHQTAAHNQGGLSNHGGTISYTTQLPSGRQWIIKLGRGQSGNCTGTGNTLSAPNTQLLIVRLGN